VEDQIRKVWEREDLGVVVAKWWGERLCTFMERKNFCLREGAEYNCGKTLSYPDNNFEERP